MNRIKAVLIAFNSKILLLVKEVVDEKKEKFRDYNYIENNIGVQLQP